MFIAGPDNGMTFGRYKIRLKTDPVELIHQPLCTVDEQGFGGTGGLEDAGASCIEEARWNIAVFSFFELAQDEDIEFGTE